MADVLCRCCGLLLLEEMRIRMRVCLACMDCDRLHGDQLQAVLTKAVADGKIAPGVALVRALIEDAHITNRLVHVVDADTGNTLEVRIPDPPRRWQVVAARSLAREELPDFASLTDAILRSRLPCKGTRAALDALAGELLEAYRMIDPSVDEVTCNSRDIDPTDPAHVIIHITARTPTLGAVVAGADVVLPDDIMTRPRGLA